VIYPGVENPDRTDYTAFHGFFQKPGFYVDCHATWVADLAGEMRLYYKTPVSQKTGEVCPNFTNSYKLRKEISLLPEIEEGLEVGPLSSVLIP
jgi:hypothetical protein